MKIVIGMPTTDRRASVIERAPPLQTGLRHPEHSGCRCGAMTAEEVATFSIRIVECIALHAKAIPAACAVQAITLTYLRINNIL